MEFPTIIMSVLSSLGITTVGVCPLGKTWLDSRFNHSSQSGKERSRNGSMRIWLSVPSRYKYEYKAKQRLYLAIAPMRFQLLLACRDLARRVEAYGRSKQHFYLDPYASSYYGMDTLYRAPRPLALAELIERQMAYAGFTIDQDALGLLWFKQAVSDSPILIDTHLSSSQLQGNNNV